MKCKFTEQVCHVKRILENLLETLKKKCSEHKRSIEDGVFDSGDTDSSRRDNSRCDISIPTIRDVDNSIRVME